MDPVTPARALKRAAGRGAALLDALGYDGAPGVVSGDDTDGVVEQLLTLLGSHGAWERFPVSIG
jgi:catalase